MADNTTLPVGAGGDTISTDDLGGGVKVQRVKVQFGADGSATDVAAGVGLPVAVVGTVTVSGTVTASGPLTDAQLRATPVPVSGTVTANAGSGTFTVAGTVTVGSITAGDNNIGNVDIVTVPAPLNVIGTGTEAAALRVTIATDSTGVVSVDDNGASLTVDGTVSINAIPAGTNNIGDVDVLTVPAPLNVVGGGTEAAALRVTIANNSTGLLSVDDNGASLTVDGTVTAAAQPGVDIGDVTINNAAGASAVNIQDGGNTITVDGTVSVNALPTGTNTIGSVKVTDGTLTATVRDTGTSDSLNVAIVDASGNQITSFGGGTQYAEDTAHVSGDSVTMAGVVQQAADAALSTDGDRSVLQVDANGYLKVNIKAGAGSGGTAMTDDAAFTVGTTSVTPAAGTYKSVRDSVDDNDAGALAMTAKRGLYTTIETPNGDSAMDDTLDAVKVVNATAANLKTAATQDGTWNITNISGTVSLPTGAATAANQTTVVNLLNGAIVDHATLAAGKGIMIQGYESGGGPTARNLECTSGGILLVQHNGTATVNTELNTAAALADGASASVSTATAGAVPLLMNGAGTLDRGRAIVNAMDTTGTGVAAVGIVAQVDDTATGTVTENQFGPVRMSTRRALLIEGVASGTAVAVSGTVTVTGVATEATLAAMSAKLPAALVGGRLDVNIGATTTGATSIAANEDDPSANLDTGVKVLAVRKATPANTSGTDGDYEMLQISGGRVWVSAVVDTALPTGTNAIGKLAANSGVDIGDVDVLSLPALATGTNTIGNVGNVAVATGGATYYHLVSAATTNATNVKASAGKLMGWYIYNSNASARKVAFHNTSGTPTAGASVVFTINVPGGAAANLASETGIAFSSGIGITTVTGLADSDATAVAANDLTINLWYA